MKRDQHLHDYPAVWPWVEDPHRVVEPDRWADFFKVIPDERYFESQPETYEERRERSAADIRMEKLETQIMGLRAQLYALKKPTETKDLPEGTGLAERYTKEV